jgi:anti-sigma B factor antagonist
MTDAFQIQVEPRPEGVIARLEGSVANAEVDSLHQMLVDLLSQRADHVVLDLRRLEYIASMALAELIQFRRDMQAYGGRLRLAGAQDNIAEVFRQTRLNDIFPMFNDPEAAIAARDP